MTIGDKKITILGSGISRIGFGRALEACLEQIHKGLGGYTCFVNVHLLVEATQNQELARCVNNSFLALADGMPLVWLSRLFKNPIECRTSGPDFTKALLTRSKDLVHGFLGGRPGQAEKIAKDFGLSAISYCPPFREFRPEHAREDWSTFLRRCSKGPPPIVWIGLGAPKQELWVHEVARLAPNTFFFPVGAAFDFLSGTKRRAPICAQKLGLEWLFRLFQEPSRLWKRYLFTNTRFLFLAAVEWFKNTYARGK